MNLLNHIFRGRHHDSRLSHRKAVNRRASLRFEAMEGRQLLSTFTVVNTIDSGTGSLRDAITRANNQSGADTINFNIPTSSGIPLSNGGGSYYQIKPATALPPIAGPLTIDGFSQTGGYHGYPAIEVLGTNAGSAVGLSITGSNVMVKGLSIAGFSAGGVQISGTGAATDTLYKDWIGIDPDQNAVGNASYGVKLMSGANNNVILNCTVSANNGPGILITDSGTSNNQVTANEIGMSPDGTTTSGNTGDGVLIQSAATYNTIGGTSSGQGNVISGNASEGVEIKGTGTSSNLVAGNIIGLDISGRNYAQPNYDGVKIDGGASNNTVGGTSSPARNVISGNTNNGVVITDSGTTNTLVAGNYIGTDSTGTTTTDQVDGRSLSNGWDGVLVMNSASAATIGGTTTSARNVIAGSVENGISINHASNVLVAGNSIGTDVTGTVPLGNGGDGVLVKAGSSNVTVGGTAAAARNLISANGRSGVHLDSATNVSVKANYIGTDASGNVASGLGNAQYGVDVLNSTNVQIGQVSGDPVGAKNTIKGNGWGTIRVSGGSNVTIGNNVS